MSEHCRELRGALGAAALGCIDPIDDVALAAHLEGCVACRAELHELRSVADALALADVSRVQRELPEPPGELMSDIVERIARERAARTRRSRRRVGLIATGLAVAAAIAAVVMIVPGSGPRPTRVVLISNRGVSANAIMRAREAGTEVTFRVEGLSDGDLYWLWLTGADGHRIAAGSFRGTETRSDLVMTAGLPLRDVRRIWVTDEADHVVLDAFVAELHVST